MTCPTGEDLAYESRFSLLLKIWPVSQELACKRRIGLGVTVDVKTGKRKYQTGPSWVLTLSRMETVFLAGRLLILAKSERIVSCESREHKAISNRQLTLASEGEVTLTFAIVPDLQLSNPTAEWYIYL